MAKGARPKRKQAKPRKRPKRKVKKTPRLTKQTVIKVAKLARLSLNQKELNKFSKDLESVLKAFDNLQKAGSIPDQKQGRETL